MVKLIPRNPLQTDSRFSNGLDPEWIIRIVIQLFSQLGDSHINRPVNPVIFDSLYRLVQNIPVRTSPDLDARSYNRSNSEVERSTTSLANLTFLDG